MLKKGKCCDIIFFGEKRGKNMEYITLLNGIKMPMAGLGTWDLRGDEATRAVLQAIELGYSLIDTAQMYENEEAIGNAITKSNVQREKLFITSKLHTPFRSYELAKNGIDDSLKKLKTDYIDLMLIHGAYEEAEEMYRAFEEALAAGKVRAIGVSNFSIERYNKFIETCNVIPAVNQVDSHVYHPRHDLKKVLDKNKTIMEAWSCLTQKKRNITEEPVLKEIGESHGKTPAQIALKYLVQQGIVVIPKTSHKERMIENMQLFDFMLSGEEIRKIDTLDEGKTLFSWTGH